VLNALKISAVLAIGVVCLMWTSAQSSAGGLPATEQKIVYNCAAGGPGTNSEICAIQPDGTGFENLTNDPLGDTGPEISPDGKLIAWRHDIIELWVMDPDGGNPRQVTDVISAFGEPTWSPDSKQLAAYCNNPDNLTVHGFCIVDVATGDVQFGNEVEFYAVEDLAWSPDGTSLLFAGEQISGGADLYVLDFGSGDVTNITNTEGDSEYGIWSPDAARIAFVGNPTDDDQDDDPFPNLYRINLDGTDRELLYDPLSLSSSHSNPAYSPDGNQIAWFCSDSEPSAKDVCINDAETGALDDRFTEGDDGLVVGSNPDWGYTAGPLFGDLDCDGDVDGDDMLLLLQTTDGLSPEPPCIPLTPNVEVNGVPRPFGDLDCNEVVDARDALPILLSMIGLPELFDGCPAVGTVVNIVVV